MPILRDTSAISSRGSARKRSSDAPMARTISRAARASTPLRAAMTAYTRGSPTRRCQSSPTSTR